MPFDTTYHIITSAKDTLLSIHPGGQDTDMYLDVSGLPKDVQEAISSNNTVIVSNKYIEPTPREKFISAIPFLLIFFGFIVYMLLRVRWRISDTGGIDSDTGSDAAAAETTAAPGQLTYYGDELTFTDLEIVAVLHKRFPYYNKLSNADKTRFTSRLQQFMASKIFKIHDKAGYKEMPILISAAAVQLTFGLEKFLLPNFRFIHVFPQEFIRAQEGYNFLEGNVSGHAINLSWKHFLEGYSIGDDGQNVGLHELAHALYYQNFITEENVDANFRDTFDAFNNYGNKVFNQESLPGNDLYSDYALKNFQEFWAESAEIFFEKPVVLKSTYPELYESLKNIFNQDPAANA
ncbi:MAG: zinc-dependent peptidase [Bacteroidetes bacterium]|nr:zinc-dependent peptidase [Bacteroidota bacterium]